MPHASLTKQSALRIAAESLCDLRTIKKAYQGVPTHVSSWTRISLAAERLGLPTPPSPYPPYASTQPAPASITALTKPQA